MISGPSSNSGKTIFTLALARALTRKGIDVCPFKTGSDFIDPSYHKLASGNNCGNLDLHMQKENGLSTSLFLNQGEFALIEGAMGYFDGKLGSCEASAFDIGEKLDINAILIYKPEGEMYTMIPKVKGMVDFSQGRIKGIVLNKVKAYFYEAIKDDLERLAGIKVLGYIPYSKDLEIASRHLGLYLPDEEKTNELIDTAADLLEKNIKIDELLTLSNKIEIKEEGYRKVSNRILIAKDEAFSFNYNENLRLLEKIADVEYFSPLNDKEIKKADLVIIGGGYPELYLKKLSENISMKKSIIDFSKNNGKILAMGGGLMYLSESINSYPMVGVFKGNSFIRDKRVRFGYVDIEIEKDCLLGKKGDFIPAKESHYGEFISPLETFLGVKRKNKSWKCGYQVRNTMGLFAHINFAYDINKIYELLGGNK